ncbi:HhH-GPD family protein [Mesoterricola silvestris]|uniref:Adenine DNA glycosylase n=1 Tax=Mesoterricola silvestris TaxID=2927979 RepID=A0AA48K8S7_9BACT|nr:hypothetical protein [Mesoterricola silvestris]BDU72651.1 A/G-specific adenine glycosylase [Mesoterricola silvestris]
MPFAPATALLAPLAPWFDARRRPMPWRAGDLDAPHPDPYAVLVSEIMLQQTQVATVIPYFTRWMERFPDAEALAAATEDEVHGLWAGLGYYRRARNLQAAARAIAGAGFPRTLEGLLELPGLGPYTAAAVAAQAFQLPTPALDGNAFRVAARVLALEGDPRRHAAALRDWLAPALAAHGPSRLTQAVMELGATVCTPVPRCASCPLLGACAARARGLQERIPPVQPRAKVTEAEIHLAAIRSPRGWLLCPPASRGLLAGLWSWPRAEAAPELEGAAEAASGYGLEARELPGWVQVYSHRRETVRPIVARMASAPGAQGLEWVPGERLPELPMGRRDQKLRAALDAPGTPLTGAGLAALRTILDEGVSANPRS